MVFVVSPLLHFDVVLVENLFGVLFEFDSLIIQLVGSLLRPNIWFFLDFVWLHGVVAWS